MADIRIKDLGTTASVTASDDFMAVDGTTNGTRKLSAATPSFAISVTVPGVSAPAATALTLAGGSSGASLVLGATTTGNAVVNVAASSPTDPQTSVFRVATGTRQLNLGINSATGYAYIQSINTGIAWAPLVLQGGAGGNVLIGTTTDISGTGGLHVAGTGTASTTTSGALRVGSNVGLSGNAGGASHFGGTVISASGFGVGDTPATATGYATSILSAGNGAFFDFARTTATARKWRVGVGLQASDTFIIEDVTAAVDPVIITGGALSAGKFDIKYTTSASSSTTGALTIGNGTAATNVAIGGGNVNAGGTLVVGGTVIHTLSATPASASAAGTVGTMSWDANYIYICTATNTWKRVAIATW
jgi:hypothetical protein